MEKEPSKRLMQLLEVIAESEDKPLPVVFDPLSELELAVRRLCARCAEHEDECQAVQDEASEKAEALEDACTDLREALRKIIELVGREATLGEIHKCASDMLSKAVIA